MVRVKKRASKRLSTKQREKILKKVREHHKKQRRDAKRNPQWKSRRKQDPGIPNSYPYKEELMNEIETQRRIQEEQRMLAKEQKQAQDEEEMEDDDADDAEEAEEALQPDDEEPQSFPHAPMLRRSLDDLIKRPESVKALIYVMDARDPSAFHSEWLEHIATQKKMPLIYVLAKADLVPAEVVTGWVYHFQRKSRPTFPISVLPTALRGHQGIDALASFLGKYKSGDIVVTGLEHVGKSSVAMALQGAFQEKDMDMQVYDSPMLVSALMTLPAHGGDVDGDDDEDDDDEDVDQPQNDDDDDDIHAEIARRERIQSKLMWMLMRNQGNVQRYKDPIMLVQALLSRVAHPVDLMLVYGTPAFGSFVPERASLADDAPMEEVVRDMQRQSDEKAAADTEQFLIGVARSVGRLKRGGIPDVLGAARILLRDWSHDALGYYAQPSERAKHIQQHGSDDEKKAWAKAAALVDAMNTVVPRKEWRSKWASRELRLAPMKAAPYTDALVFAPVPEEEEEEEDVMYSDEDENEEHQDEEDADTEDEDDQDEDDQDESVEDDDDMDEDDLEAEEAAAAKVLQGKSHSQAKSRTVQTKSSKPRRSAPKPGEAYDINAYF